MNQEIDEIEVLIIEEREKAFLLESFSTKKREWFPYSQISFRSRNTKTGRAVAEIPSWLLKDRRDFVK
jgi:hypothetical protein